MTSQEETSSPHSKTHELPNSELDQKPVRMNPESSENYAKQSMALLGWDLVCQSLAGYALSSVTHARCLELKPEQSLFAAQTLLQETEAMVTLLNTAEGIPLSSFADLNPILQEAEQQRMIDPEQGLAVLDLLTLVRNLQRRLRAETAPDLLQVFADRLHPLPFLHKELNRCLDREEGVRDNASPELKAAVREAANAKQQLESSVRKLMSQSSWKDALQDAYITEREGRIVLPVKSESRSRVQGIVHDSSGSGQTLFVEPSSVVPLNNQLKIARMTVSRERMRVLGQLAENLLEEESSLRQNLKSLAKLDLIHARARLACVMNARPFELTETGGVNLVQARNPELVLTGRHVVPNTLQWDPEVRVLIISGPNTGGKTVTLKTLGLMSLMARSGLLLPLDENSTLPFFPEVYADIGDEQDIGQDLSTFSGHLVKIIYILKHAPKGSLILLDELGIATDPQQGAALAQAILTKMKAHGMTTLVSTHYLSLKSFAQTESGFLNACTQFNMDTLSPTYQLVFGVPGQSAALETAERLGLDPSVLLQARQLYDKQDHRAEALLEELTRQKQALEEERTQLSSEREQTQQALREQSQIRDRLNEEQINFKRSKSQKLQVQLREAKREIRRLIEGARGKKSVAHLKRTETELSAMGREAGNLPSKRRAWYTVPANSLRTGDEVMLDGYDAIGILEEDPKNKSRVQVRLGNLSTTVETKRLFGHQQGLRTRPRDADQPQVNIQTETHQTATTSCDLRGKNLEEARNALELFLSQALVNNCSRITLIHGHGTGKVKAMVRDYLGSTKIGKNFFPAPREQGGDGATIVEF